MMAGSRIVLIESRDVDAEHQRHRQEHQQDERDQRRIQGPDQPGEVVEHAEAAVADGVGNRRSHANWRVAHHDIGELEHRFGDDFAPGDHRPSSLAEHAECNREDDAEHDNLEHVAARHRVEDGLRHDVQQDLIPGLRAPGDIRRAGGGQHDADTGTGDVDGDQPDDQCDRRHDFEVDDGPQAHPADGLDVTRSSNARDQRGENQGRDDHLDHPQEQLAERPGVGRPFRVDVIDDRANCDADGQPNEDLMGQADAPCSRSRRGGGRNAQEAPPTDRLRSYLVIFYDARSVESVPHSTYPSWRLVPWLDV